MTIEQKGKLKPFKDLRADGLRIGRNLDMRGKTIELQFEAPAQLNNTTLYLYRSFSLGAYSYLRSGSVKHVDSIGRYTSIGPNVTLGEAEHPTNWLSTSPVQYYAGQFDFYPPEVEAAPKRLRRRSAKNDPSSRTGLVSIGNDVWIGANVLIRRGVTIGDGAVLASGAIVGKDVAPYSIVGGIPAKPIKMRFEQAVIDRLQRVRWWDFDINDLAGIAFEDVESALDEIERRESLGTIKRRPIAYSKIVLESAGYQTPA